MARSFGPLEPMSEGWSRRARPGPPPVLLTDRERAVLRFLATGMSTAEIAGELCVSINTVKTHLAATTANCRPGSGVKR